MSADLFAAFSDSSQPSTTQQQQSSGSSVVPNLATDPFSFPGTGSSLPQSAHQQQQQQQQQTQWLPSHQPAIGFSLFNEPQPGGGSGDTGGFQSRPLSLPPAQQPPQVEGEEDDDGWGDFEVASPNLPPEPANPTRARVIRASTLDMMTNKLLDLGLETSTPEPWQQRPSWEQKPQGQQATKAVRKPDPNVLFDADFEADSGAQDEDDDFGDFETGTPASVTAQPAPVKSTTTSDLLSLDQGLAPPKKQPPGLVLSNAALQAKPSSYPEAPKSPYGSFHERKPEPVKKLQVEPPKVAKVLQEANQASPSPITAWPTVDDEGFGNNWEEFKDLPETTKPTKTQPASKSSTKVPAPDWEWQDWGTTEDQPPPKPNTTTTSTKETPSAATLITATTTTTTTTTTTPPDDDKPGPPPTTIPPPAILLSLLPSLLDLASAALLKPLLTLPPSSPAYQRVLAADATLNFLEGYLALATVAARLVAGRKHRWHRDKFLQQGMAISAAAPVGAGGQRGMKLASVDRAQAVREEREAAEVVGAWGKQVGRLRGIVAGVRGARAGSDGGKGLERGVPEISLNMAVSVAKGVPTAPRACVVCGLRRDERIAKVDGVVEDSFGEWWVEFWGHRECRNFWVRHERELRQR